MLKIEIVDFVEAHRSACAELLAGLPEWFGIEQANRDYIESLGRLTTAVAISQDPTLQQIVGFVALQRHSERSVEIHVLASAAGRHNQGIGSMLLKWTKFKCVSWQCPWLHVKTRGPATPDSAYEKTRGFYCAQGFEPLFESLTLWGPSDAALILVQKLAV